MAKRGMFFQLYLNPKNPRDRKILAWIEEIPRWQRSKMVKEILYRTIQGLPHQQFAPVTKHHDRNAAHAARKLFDSFQ